MMNKRAYAAAFALAVLALLGTAAGAQEVGETDTIDRGQIRFARGASSTTVRGNLRRGVRDQYLIRARPGQLMTVRFESADPLMGFDLFVTEGLGAEPVTEADKLQREWSGRLPRGDEYYLNVMTAGRGAAYSFEISIGPARAAATSRPATSAASLPAPEFRAELAKVKRQTRVPVLLPDALPGALDRPLFVTASGIADSYGFSLALSRRCGGANACTVGNFEGSKGGTVTEELEAVQLANGITGRYKPLTCGASCSAPSIEWQDYPFFYSIQLKLNYGDDAKDKAALVALANSAIKAGPR
jgi:hypothetical protein